VGADGLTDLRAYGKYRIQGHRRILGDIAYTSTPYRSHIPIRDAYELTPI
jgi:hypothetical protein